MSGQSGPIWAVLKLFEIQILNLNRLTHIQFHIWGRILAWKVKEITHYLNHDLTFYWAHNQLCVPQYKVYVQSTLGYITLTRFTNHACLFLGLSRYQMGNGVYSVIFAYLYNFTFQPSWAYKIIVFHTDMIKGEVTNCHIRKTYFYENGVASQTKVL